MFALALTEEDFFPLIGRGHGSRRKLFNGRGKSRECITPGVTLDCSSVGCRQLIENKGLFGSEHFVGRGANLDAYKEERTFGEPTK